MIAPFQFLKRLEDSSPPPVVHLSGDDDWLRETVRRAVVTAWCGEGGRGPVERLAGASGAADLRAAMGAGSLFEPRKVVVLSDPPPGARGATLAQMGKNQLAAFLEAVESMPEEVNRLVVETGPLKKNSTLGGKLAGISEQVDVSTPTGGARKQWLTLFLKKLDLRVDRELEGVLMESAFPLANLHSDLEKVSLALEPGGTADLPLWNALSRSDPDTSVWELGGAVGAGKAKRSLEVLRDLAASGGSVYEITPALLSWNQQRLQVKTFDETGGRGSPPAMPPFIATRIRGEAKRETVRSIREQQADLFHLDRCLKQSWEDPFTLLEKTVVKFASGTRK